MCGFESRLRYHLYFNKGGHVIRTLKFIVQGEHIALDPSCIVNGRIPTYEEVRAEFIFSEEWVGIPKVAGFFSMRGQEYEPQIIEDNSCTIPNDAKMYSSFRMQIFGKTRNMETINTDVITIRHGGKR